MFGLSFGEIFIVLVVALMVLGPQGMPKLARTLGKGLRDFRRATGDLKGAFEEEFYKLDQEIEAPATRPTAAVASAGAEGAAATAAAEPAPLPATDPATLHRVPEGALAATEGAVVARAPEGAVARAPEGAVPRAPEGAVARAPVSPVAEQAPAGSTESRASEETPNR